MPHSARWSLGAGRGSHASRDAPRGLHAHGCAKLQDLGEALGQLTVGKLPSRLLLGQGMHAAKSGAGRLEALQRRQPAVHLDVATLGAPGAFGFGCLETRVEPVHDAIALELVHRRHDAPHECLGRAGIQRRSWAMICTPRDRA